MKSPIKVLITGATGCLAYSLIPMVANGQVYGKDQPIILHLMARRVSILEGVVMELKDCAYPLVRDVVVTSDEEIAFRDVDFVFMLASMPRREGMQRKDLLEANVKICAQHGRALACYAKQTVKVLVGCNPTNTCALITAKYASSMIPAHNITALTRLDHNRTVHQLAVKHDVNVKRVSRVVVWGNHSNTQFPDVSNACIDGQPVPFEGHDNMLMDTVIKRGYAVLAARNNISALSAAKGAADHMRDWWTGTDDWVSMGVISDGNEYGVPEGLVYSFPVTIDRETKEWKVVDNIDPDERAVKLIKISADELVAEKQEALIVLQNL
ncbi:unnamed protein product [Oppiella nova]|uniref:Malate dehydrogenase n=1 Tax=Oppiella nova TaxID=334625 RepID=A0A7R9QVG2_9ACAR|nr:unnamed protein product [Oppiella nova]CAG2177082.1 unnamed protein product [Oppiella nova]